MARRVSTHQAAKELGYTVQHVARLCAAGKLTATRAWEKGNWKVELPDKKPAPQTP